jgi:hypothetical protein
MTDTILTDVKTDAAQAGVAVRTDLEQLVVRDELKTKNWLARNATGLAWGFVAGAAVVALIAAVIRML